MECTVLAIATGFHAALNLGVPRQPTSTMNQPSKQPKNSLTQPPIMATSFMSEVVTFNPSSLIFHPSQMRAPSQPAYLPPGSPVNMKHTSKPGPTKPHIPKNQAVVRPTPKQPTSLPPVSHTKATTSNALSRPKVESPVEPITYVHSPPGGSYVLPPHPIVTQKGSTLSKMLMTPAQQHTSVVSSTGLQQKGMVEMGGAYVSHNTTLRSAVPSKHCLYACSIPIS